VAEYSEWIPSGLQLGSDTTASSPPRDATLIDAHLPTRRYSVIVLLSILRLGDILHRCSVLFITTRLRDSLARLK
jgi:hypothetical protein